MPTAAMNTHKGMVYYMVDQMLPKLDLPRDIQLLILEYAGLLKVGKFTLSYFYHF